MSNELRKKILFKLKFDKNYFKKKVYKLIIMKFEFFLIF